MPNSNKPKSDTWRWVFIGLLISAIALAVLYYIGWFDNRTHVDTPDGDNVEANYQLDNPESPSEVEWQNADGASLDEVIADPEAPTATPPSAQ